MTDEVSSEAGTPDKLYTIGYEGAAIEDFIAALRSSGADLLIDVRDAPWSRNRVYTKGALRSAVEAAGIGYVHLKGLGTPKAGREAAKAGDAGAYRRIYAERLQSPEGMADFSEAVSTARSRPVCLMCMERDPAHCHRTILAGLIAAETGQTIAPLSVKKGAAAQPDLF